MSAQQTPASNQTVERFRAALQEIARPISGIPVGDPWAFYADLQSVATAALAPAQGEGS